MQLREFCEQISLSPEAIRTVLDFPLSEAEYRNDALLFQNNPEQFYDSVLNKEKAYQHFLYDYCKMAVETEAEKGRNNISWMEENWGTHWVY